jgi:site-specific recombinase XerD
MKWQEALKDFKLYLKIERGLALNSVENYGRYSNLFMKFLKRLMPEANHALFRAYVVFLIT